MTVQHRNDGSTSDKAMYEAIAARALARAKAELDDDQEPERPHEPDNEALAVVHQLPLWAAFERAVPSAVARSALFGVLQKRKSRPAVRDELVASWKGTDIKYTGFALGQAELDVWMQAVQLSREQLGHVIRFTRRSFLKSLGRRGTGQKDSKWLESCFELLSACNVRIHLRDEQFTYAGSLVDHYAVDEKTGRWAVRLNPLLVGLFAADHTRVHWEKRLQLKGDLAKYLHSYVCSHKATFSEPHRIGLARLQALCGSRGVPRRFRFEVKRAMIQLVDQCVVASWGISDDVLTFTRVPRRRALQSS